MCFSYIQIWLLHSPIIVKSGYYIWKMLEDELIINAAWKERDGI